MSASWAAALGQAAQGSELWGAVLRLVLALVVLLPLVYVVTLLYSKRLSSAGAGKVLKVLDAVHLGPNRSIILLEVGDRVLVVGATPHQVTTLAELRDPQVIESLTRRAGTDVTGSFAKFLEAKLRPFDQSKDGGKKN